MNSPTQEGQTEVRHTPTPWFVFNMVHEKNGRPMTPEELGEYVTNNIRKSIEDGGSATRFLFITQAGEGVPDICHIGNGPSGPANAAFIVRACNSHDALTAALAQARREVEGLREALRELVRETESILDLHPGISQWSIRSALQTADVALDTNTKFAESEPLPHKVCESCGGNGGSGFATTGHLAWDRCPRCLGTPSPLAQSGDKPSMKGPAHE